LSLPRTVGNQAYGQLIQAKLSVNRPGDPYEREADQMADAVMRLPLSEGPDVSARSSTIQRKCAACSSGQGPCPECAEEEETIQRKELDGGAPRWVGTSPNSLRVGSAHDPAERVADRAADRVMRMPAIPSARPAQGGQTGANALRREITAARSTGSFPAPPAATRAVAAMGSGRSLSQAERSFFEPRFGSDFSHVRLHESAQADAAARMLRARAFTYGHRIAMARGEYQEGTDRGHRLLAHELTHVLQQAPHPRVRRAEVEDRPAVCTALTDIRTDVNTFVRAEIAAARAAPGTAPLARFLTEVNDRTGGTRAVGPVETFIENLPVTKRFLPPSSLAGTRFSSLSSATLSIPNIRGFNIYDLQRLGLAHVVGATAKIHGQCVGGDKLGHMFQQGFDYYNIRRGSTQAAAESFGRATEISRAGLGATGVYSRADLAANLAGLTFWTDLAANPSGYTFDIASYVTASWNEYRNPNFYEASVGGQIWATQLTHRWSGSFGPSTALQPITVDLNATPAGVVTGTFSHSGGPGGSTVTGTIAGRITFNTTSVSGTIPSAVLHGGAGAHSATPISSVTILFDWVSGGNSGKGEWNSVNEHQLDGTFGNGSSRTGAGLFNISRT